MLGLLVWTYHILTVVSETPQCLATSLALNPRDFAIFLINNRPVLGMLFCLKLKITSLILIQQVGLLRKDKKKNLKSKLLVYFLD